MGAVESRVGSCRGSVATAGVAAGVWGCAAPPQLHCPPGADGPWGPAAWRLDTGER